MGYTHAKRVDMCNKEKPSVCPDGQLCVYLVQLVIVKNFTPLKW